VSVRRVSGSVAARPSAGLAPVLAVVTILVATACGPARDPGAPRASDRSPVTTPVASPWRTVGDSRSFEPVLARNGAVVVSRVDPEVMLVGGSVPQASLVLLDPDGTTRVLADDAAYGTAPAFSPDGTQLAFVTERAIDVLDVAGGGRTPIVRCDPPGCTGLGAPAWSPDGTQLAFVSARAGGAGLWTVPARGGEPRLLTERQIRGAPAWSPDGATIAVISGRVQLIDARSGEVAAQVALPGGVRGGAVAWTPDARALVVTARIDGVEGLWVVAIDGSAPPRLLSGCPDPGCTDVGPVMAPDGRSVLFTRARCELAGGDCSTGDLFVVPIEGGSARPFDEGPSLDCCAAWQPRPQS